ncbi:unnamed protein product [Caenorhabditis nigoni]
MEEISQKTSNSITSGSSSSSPNASSTSSNDEDAMKENHAPVHVATGDVGESGEFTAKRSEDPEEPTEHMDVHKLELRPRLTRQSESTESSRERDADVEEDVVDVEEERNLKPGIEKFTFFQNQKNLDRIATITSDVFKSRGASEQSEEAEEEQTEAEEQLEMDQPELSPRLTIQSESTESSRERDVDDEEDVGDVKEENDRIHVDLGKCDVMRIGSSGRSRMLLNADDTDVKTTKISMPLTIPAAEDNEFNAAKCQKSIFFGITSISTGTIEDTIKFPTS